MAASEKNYNRFTGTVINVFCLTRVKRDHIVIISKLHVSIEAIKQSQCYILSIIQRPYSNFWQILIL